MFYTVSDVSHVKHVTYLQNGAVISNVPNVSPNVITDSISNSFQPPDLSSLEYPNKQEDAFVLQNPSIVDNDNTANQVWKTMYMYKCWKGRWKKWICPSGNLP